MTLAVDSPTTGLLIEHACPQCGAPVTLEETDRLLRCPYCRVKSYLVTEEVFHYLLPPRTPEPEVLYLPYWRFRGTHYACLREGVQHRLVDLSQPAQTLPGLPPSLGLRPQAMRLRFATRESPGRFVPPATSPGEARAEFSARLDAEMSQLIFHSDLIGETLSLVYAPFRIEQGWEDAILERRIAPEPPARLTDLAAQAGPAAWQATFIPTLCPHCGWDLEGERDALVLACRNCRSLWRAAQGGLTRVDCAGLPGGNDTSAYLPFWRLEAEVDGLVLASYADFVAAANLPRVARPAWAERPLQFWIPAFKVRPQLFLRAAQALTLAQPMEEPEPVLFDRPCHPVTLPLSEAAESLKILLALMLRPPVFHLPRLPEVRVELHRTLLVLVPFAEHRSEWVHEAHPLAIDKNALRFGLGL